MVATLESPRSTGQTLLFPSPTHLHHPDATSATIRSIRRSLSRSPSKAPAFRLISSTSPSPSSRSPLTASPVSPSSAPETARTPTTVKPPSPLAVPFPPSAKLQRASVRKPYVGRASTRSKTSPADLARCPLGLSRDQGNARPRSPPIAKPTGSARETRSASPADRLSRGQGFPTVGVHLADDKGSVPTQNGFQADKAIQMNAGGSSGTSSPLKRTDGIMDLDQTSLGSPVAKRRSMHSGFFGADFNVFDHASTSARPSDQPNERSRAFDPSGGRGLLPGGTSPFFASMPKRSSSLRKSTLQQRYTDKPIFAQSRPNSDLAFEFASNGAQEPRHRHHRMSLDNFVPSMARESPFTSTGSLPSASIHNLPHGNAAPQAGAKQGQVHRHPLSQAISQSSSASSLAEESPTHVPSHQHEHPGPTIAFSKSLPMGGVRPIFKRPMSSDGPNQAASSTGPTYVTPQHYRLVKPLPAAFMSTGLISKRNRNPEELLPGGGGNKAAMPDTPCKRPALSFDAVPFSGRKSIATSPLPSGYEDDVPTTPLHLHQSKLATGSVGTGVGIFGTKFVDGSATRRSSFLSIDGDDNSHSPSGRGEDQQSEYELPPTPTKQVYSLGGTPMAKPNNEPGSIIGNMSFSKAVGSFSTLPVGLQSSREARSCKSSFPHPSPRLPYTDGHRATQGSGCAFFRFSSPSSLSPSSSFSRSRRLRNGPGFSPSPLSEQSLKVSKLSFPSTGPSLAKGTFLVPASPIDHLDFAERSSPHTPQESMLPPDPSGLSISGHASAPGTGVQIHLRKGTSMFPPATPTAGRDGQSQHPGRITSVTPIGGFATNDVDASLTSRFDRVELIGTGEFSQVYRVTQAAEPRRPRSRHSDSSARVSYSSAQSLTDQVFAVKKSRHPYAGNRDRRRKLQEVNVLKALGHSDHVVHLIDDWEDKNYLYIQTEFCEEGSLDMFLTQVGRKARLDDFRIWKIMLELGLVSQIAPNTTCYASR